MGSGLVVQGLHKRFGDVVALSGLDLEARRGEMVGFLGANGAGKTTTMRAILGLVAVDSGTITWEGEALGPQQRRRIGYMPQERGLYPRMKVHEHIAYIGRLAGLEREKASGLADRWCERVGLAERRDDLIQELSVGNQQRVQLAVALVHEPDLLVLDEPFAGLDPVAVSTMSEVMVEQLDRGASVVFSSHQLDRVQDLTESVTIIAGGRTRASGGVIDLRSSSPDRVLDVTWNGPAPQWSPHVGQPIASEAGRSRFLVPADTDAGALIAEAATKAPLRSVSYEPPSLEEVFREVTAQ